MATAAFSLARSLQSRRVWIGAALFAFAWAGVAYAALPLAWRHYEHQRALDGAPMLTRTPLGIPGDPLNFGLVGSEADIVCAFEAAGWSPADPVTLATSLKIVGSVVLDRAYPDAPVSSLLYKGKREDLAFQKAEGKSADRRHHVRLWKALDAGDEGRPVWLGAASFDRGVGLSHYTFQVTHHIDPDLDAERDKLGADLSDAGVVDEVYFVTGIGVTVNGRNGGGDRYFTDGEVLMARLAPDCGSGRSATPKVLPNPPLVEGKNAVWRAIRKWL